MDKEKRKEMQEQMNRQYIDSKLNNVLEPMALGYFANAFASQDPS